MSQITTHVLDTARGHPAVGVPVRLDGPSGYLGQAVTDADGRIRELGPATLERGRYTLTIDVAAYDGDSFFPEIVLAFDVSGTEHYHVPVLLAPYSYSTYRGS